jgi:hypothetical protein
MTKKYKYAQALAKRGFKIFRLRPNEKVPFSSGWQEEAKADATPWADGADFNIGVLCGEGMLAIDIDMKSGVDGEAGWKALNIEESDLQVRTVSDPSGRHIYFSLPEGVSISNSASKIAKGVDVRGVGGYVVGPGSVIDGIEYTPINVGAVMTEAPEELIKLCTKSKARVNDFDVPAGDLDTKENIESANIFLSRAQSSIEGAGGDATAFGVAAKVREMGISEGECLDLMMGTWNENCVPPWSGEELSVKVSNAYKYASSKIGSDTPEAQFADEPDSGVVIKRKLTKLEKYNSRHALVMLGTGFVITDEYLDDSDRRRVSLHGKEAFNLMKVADSYINAEGRRIYFSKEWLMSPKRRTYRGFTFDPKTIGPVDGKFNQWNGFTLDPLVGLSIEEAKVGCALFLKHVRDVVCGGDEAQCNWMLNHFAHLIQHPQKKPETSIVIVGDKGTGKSLVFDVIGGLVRDNYIVTAEKRMLLGNFNSHMETALVFQFEEAFWAGDKTAEGKLKLIVTGKYHMIERKGYEPYMVGNFARIYITSNNAWAVPASVDERRWAVFACLNDKAGNKKYFKDIFDQLTDDEGHGYRCLMTLLMQMDVDQTMVHTPPKTEALADQKMETLDDVSSWLYDCLREGALSTVGTGFEDEIEWLDKIETSDVYDAYVLHSKGRGFHYPRTQRSFGKHLKKMLGDCVLREREMNKGSRLPVYKLASLEDCRSKYVKWFGHGIDWEI